MDDRDELIRQRAYEIWEHEGRPEGADLRHWFRAREEITRQDHGSQEIEQRTTPPGSETEGATQATTAPAPPPIFENAEE